MANTIDDCSSNKREAHENISDETIHEPPKKIRKLNTRPLAVAIRKNDIQKVRNFLSEQKDDYIPGSNTDTPLHLAAEGGNIEIVKLLFSYGYGTVNAVNCQNKTPLQLAIKNNHEDVINYLFEKVAKSVLSPKKLETFIRFYIKRNKSKILKSLIEEDNISGYLINFAVEENCFESLKSILKFSIIVNKTPFFDFLHTAAKNGNLEIVKLLFNNGFDVIGAKNDQRVIPLHLAVDAGHEEVVKFLWDNGAKNKLSFKEFNQLIQKSIRRNCLYILKSLNSTHTISASVLNFAASYGHLKILKLLMECGVKIQSTSETPLQCAARCGHLNIVKYLIESQHTNTKLMDCGSTDLNSRTSLHLAAEFGHFEIVKYFIENLLFINETETFNGLIPLELAVKKGHLKIVKYLLEKLNFQKKGNVTSYFSLHYATPLHCAAQFGHFEIVEYLIENGLFINKAKNFKGSTPLELALNNGHLKIVKYLLKKQAKGSINYHEGINEKIYSLFDYAASHNYMYIMRYLIKYGADINVKENNETLLHKAISFGHEKIVLQLLELGAKEFVFPKDISAEEVSDEILTILLKAGHSLKTYFGRREPILFAAEHGYLKFLEALLSPGVDVDIKDKHYETALNFAVNAREPKVVNILLKAGANLKGTISTRSKLLESCIRRAYWTKGFKTQVEILRNLLDHVPNEDLQQILVSCINLAIKAKTSITIIELLLEYDFNNYYELPVDCALSEISVFNALIHHIEKIETLIKFQSLILKNCNAYVYRDVQHPLTSRIVFLKSMFMITSIEEEIHLQYVQKCNLEEWCKKCHMEIDRMQKTKILPGGSDVTYYDFLAKPIYKVVNYVRNEKLMTNLNYNCFVVYKEFFERRISRVKSRSLYVDQSQKLFYNAILNGFQIHLPNEIVDKICEYLTVFHLKRLQQAFS